MILNILLLKIPAERVADMHTAAGKADAGIAVEVVAVDIAVPSVMPSAEAGVAAVLFEQALLSLVDTMVQVPEAVVVLLRVAAIRVPLLPPELVLLLVVLLPPGLVLPLVVLHPPGSFLPSVLLPAEVAAVLLSVAFLLLLPPNPA